MQPRMTYRAEYRGATVIDEGGVAVLVQILLLLDRMLKSKASGLITSAEPDAYIHDHRRCACPALRRGATAAGVLGIETQTERSMLVTSRGGSTRSGGSTQ